MIALAGRRIDPDPADHPRFPFDRVDGVRTAITKRLGSAGTRVLVCAAACGADLLALGAAGDLGIRTRIVLPFRADRFRETSVVDRPNREFWGPLFDRVTTRARAAEDLIALGCAEDDERAYSAANQAIIAESKALAVGPDGHTPTALVIWEGAARGPDDATQEFIDLARAADFRIEELNSLRPGPATPMPAAPRG